MSEIPPEVDSQEWMHCNSCRRITHHGERARQAQQIDDEESGYWETTVHRFMVCAGCDTATIRRESASAADPNISVDYYPERAAGAVPFKFFRKLPIPLRRIYQESVSALNRELYILSAAGLRALVEGICADKGIAGGNLQRRIDGLRKLLPSNIVENLHSFRFMGNEAVHSLTPPPRDTLRMAVDVSEDLLNFLYELDYKASRLRHVAGPSEQPSDLEDPPPPHSGD
jgi:hypothetical protein